MPIQYIPTCSWVPYFGAPIVVPKQQKEFPAKGSDASMTGKRNPDKGTQRKEHQNGRSNRNLPQLRNIPQVISGIPMNWGIILS